MNDRIRRVQTTGAMHVGNRAAAYGTVGTDSFVLPGISDLELSNCRVGWLQVQTKRTDAHGTRNRSLQEGSSGYRHFTAYISTRTPNT